MIPTRRKRVHFVLVYIPSLGTNIKLVCLRQQIGQPVGTEHEAVRMENVVLFYPKVNAENILHGFVDAVVAAAEATRKGYISIFRWNSVILPHATKAKLIADLDDIVSEDTKAFYADHGIPYKRSYLFYGVPGTGKTSLIQAMGGQYERKLYFLQPTHPKMTDDSLRSAIEQVPRKSITVLEDIDAHVDAAVVSNMVFASKPTQRPSESRTHQADVRFQHSRTCLYHDIKHDCIFFTQKKA
ncbi:hypothetical protein AC1031_003559 [Aphanomyces cochlioides]|nr:hypothetical protein AC1031_003559 [Aphanomyces cochlioides]